MRRQSGSAKLVSLVILLIWLAGIGAAAANRQNIDDWWQLRNYQAPGVVAQLATQDTMTDYARKIFYVNHPGIDDKGTFNQKCPNNGGEQTIVLGCYHGGQSGIFLLSVDDPRLNGVEQVTAGHEMLHAAYDRLNRSDKTKVDAMLTDYYEHDLHDQRLLDTIAAYKKSEPHDVVNEMHSVFGTEVANLPAGLEQYYKRYFADRGAVASFGAQYQAEFTSRHNLVVQDDGRLADLKTQISNQENDLKSKQSAIDAQRSQLLSERGSGNVDAYNAGVLPYNRLVDAYNGEVQSVQSMINQYNQLVASRNAVALEEDQLVQDLSTSVTPITN